MLVSFPRETVTTGARVTIASKVALHCCGVVTVTLYVPLALGVMLCVVAPPFHRKVLPVLPAFNIGGELMQALTSCRTSTGMALNWMFIASLALQLFALVTVTE